jgi:putative folate metabolism gamma-glutamate ligase
MKIKAIRSKIVRSGDSLPVILDSLLPKINENSVIVVTSKIVSLCEGQVVRKDTINKLDLIRSEADYYLESDEREYPLTIKNNILIPSAGIDESNAEGNYILWPKNPQQSANRIRSCLLGRDKIRNLGVIISDSKTSPLRSGTTGVCLAFSGFKPVNSYIGKTDLFGRKLEVSKSNVADGLAAAAVLVMGEGAEQTPIAVITELPFVNFVSKNPSKSDLSFLKIDMVNDIYAPLLVSVNWLSG